MLNLLQFVMKAKANVNRQELKEIQMKIPTHQIIRNIMDIDAVAVTPNNKVSGLEFESLKISQ